MQISRNPTNTGQSNIQLTPTESQIMKAVGDWLKTQVLSAPWTIQQGQQNRTSTMDAPFAIMQIVSRNRYATNARHYGADGTLTITKPEKMAIQITTFGQGAGNAVSTINACWRDPDACEWFRQNLPQMAPCYARDPIQHAFVTAEKQYEDQWSVDVIADVQAAFTRSFEGATQLSMNQITEAQTLHITTDTSP